MRAWNPIEQIARAELYRGITMTSPHKAALTPKQERFCNFIAQGATRSEAYRHAYDASRMLPSTVHRKAHEVMENGKVTARLSELRATTAAKVEADLAITKETVLRGLMHAHDQAVAIGAWSTATRALELMGRHLGMFRRRKMVVEVVRSLDQPAQEELEARVFELAERLGYRMVPIERK